MPNPVRIYVLHHPDSTVAADLTNRIYDWFRLPSLEGIPVYVRSVAASADGQPSLPASDGKDPFELEYLIPLVDCHMVRDPIWHDYLIQLASGCEEVTDGTCRTFGWHMFPVALDPSAFNLPRSVTRRNFIRYGTVSKPEGATPSEEMAMNAEETLKHLTEAMARDLNGRLFPKQASNRFKIFISYSRADSTDIAKALRDYIQSETQCQVFLDENDIAFGKAFDKSIQANLDDHTRAMIVVNGDNYADRPWCRWEISKFTEPRKEPLFRSEQNDGQSSSAQIHLFHPLLVVDAVKGPAMTRVIPELSQAPLVRWEPGRAKHCFSVLMREVLLGLKDILVARQVLTDKDVKGAVVVNRLPGPIAIEQLLRRSATGEPSGQRSIQTIHHPGNGLPLIELRLLKRTFEGVRFRAFRDIMRDGARSLKSQTRTAAKMHQELEGLESGSASKLPLRGKVIAISSAHAKQDLAAIGYLPQHQDEALIHLLRPLVRMGADLLFGGLPPKAVVENGGTSSWSATRNLTRTLLQILSDERSEANEEVANPATPARRGSLMFNVPPWPLNMEITPTDEATWINICRVVRVTPEDAGLPPWGDLKTVDKDNPPKDFRRYVALTLSEMRRRLAKRFQCRVPMDGVCTVEPSAFIFIGGKLADFFGIMPGIMEEFLHAAKTGRPIYLLGGLGGAAGVIARALNSKRTERRPRELTVSHYRAQPSPRNATNYGLLLEELKIAGGPNPEDRFDELWSLIEEHRGGSLNHLFNNGLSHEENAKLITETNTFDAVRLVWTGFSEAPNMLNSFSAPHEQRQKQDAVVPG